MENNLMESKKVRKSNTWLEHVKAFREAHSDLSYKDVLKQAKETYKPVVDQVKQTETLKKVENRKPKNTTPKQKNKKSKIETEKED